MSGKRQKQSVLADLVVCMDPKDIHPPHEPYRFDDLEAISQSMKANGWIGRPLPVQIIEGEYWATCGSHRIQAALNVGLVGIPVLLQPAVVSVGLSQAFDDFMMMDQAVDNYTEELNVDTWDPQFLRSLKEEGIHPEVIKLLKINEWDCSR